MGIVYKRLKINKYREGVFYMGLLRWIGAIVVCFWVLGLIFSLGGSMVHILLVVAAIMFGADMILGRKLT